MKNRLLITLTDFNGSRQLAFSRPVLTRISIAIMLLLIALIIYPVVLNRENVSLTTVNNTLKLGTERSLQQAGVLERQYKQLLTAFRTKSDSLAVKEQQLASLELQINYPSSTGLADSERFADLSKQIAFRQMVLQLLPNGKPSGYQRVTSAFGKRYHPFLKTNHQHKGIDLKSKIGTEVVATADGVVTSVQNTAKGFGKLIKITHGLGFITYYGHLKTIGVDAGTFVNKGDVIGYSGNSGSSTGPHLHYEIRFGRTPVNPAPFILWTLNNFDSQLENVEDIPWGSLMASMQRLMAVQQPPLSPKIVTSTEKSRLTAACTSTAGCQATSSVQGPSSLASQGASMGN